MAAPRRFASVDALRGLTVAAMLLVNDPGDWNHVYAPLEHSEWDGFTPTDLVFPMFLFVAGASIALGLVPRLLAGARRDELQSQVLWRALRIVVLGLCLHAVALWAYGQPAFRPWGVLQRIGACYAVAATLALYLRARGQWLCIAALLLGYWALLAAGGSHAPWDNIASRVDTWMLGRHVHQFDAASGRGHDPEGLLGTLPAIATTLLGVRAGAWLRYGDTAKLFVAGFAALALGWLWSYALPINKNLWTSSFVLWAGGWSMLLLALFHLAIDVNRWPALGRSLGVNAIAAYAGSWLLACALAKSGWSEPIYRHGFASWLAPSLGDKAASLGFAIAFVACWWAIARWMDKRRWHLTV
ncbi:MAG: heparan-alpha-glucosaminide N-acetyltransferase domain-containing protein [Thermomonas sp.]